MTTMAKEEEAVELGDGNNTGGERGAGGSSISSHFSEIKMAVKAP